MLGSDSGASNQATRLQQKISKGAKYGQVMMLYYYHITEGNFSPLSSVYTKNILTTIHLKLLGQQLNKPNIESSTIAFIQHLRFVYWSLQITICVIICVSIVSSPTFVKGGNQDFKQDIIGGKGRGFFLKFQWGQLVEAGQFFLNELQK